MLHASEQLHHLRCSSLDLNLACSTLYLTDCLVFSVIGQKLLIMSLLCVKELFYVEHYEQCYVGMVLCTHLFISYMLTVFHFLSFRKRGKQAKTGPHKTCGIYMYAKFLIWVLTMESSDESGHKTCSGLLLKLCLQPSSTVYSECI